MAKNNKPENDKEDIDFSLDSLRKEIDSKLDEKAKKTKDETTVQHISERIKKGLEMKNNLPNKDFMTFKAEEGTLQDGTKVLKTTTTDTDGVPHVEITKGVYKLDLRNDAEYWFIRTPVVVPQMIRHAVRSAIDRKKCYELEKRKLELPIWLIIGLGVGAVIIIISLVSMMM